jgi:uncharacterized Zn-binding protein involved in type VI secretion
MGTKIARVGDATYGYCSSHEANYSGVVTTGATTVNAEGQKVTRLGDTVTSSCGHTGTITEASVTVKANSARIARLGDAFSGTYTGTITGSATTVFAG